jgi:hypothetical protein
MNNLTLEESTEIARQAELDQLEAHVNGQLFGRVRNLRIAFRSGGLVLSGNADSYYEKQLAQQAVMKASELPLIANQIHVR